MLPNTSLSEAAILSERVRFKLESSPLINEKFIIKMTASFGTVSTDCSINFKMLIERADKLLYKAKRDGRNRIEIERN